MPFAPANLSPDVRAETGRNGNGGLPLGGFLRLFKVLHGLCVNLRGNKAVHHVHAFVLFLTAHGLFKNVQAHGGKDEPPTQNERDG